MRYTRTAIALHWLIALLIVAAFPVGLYMTGLKLSPTKLKLYAYHKWLGITVVLLAIVRLAWRVRHPAPPPPAHMPVWQQRVATAIHHLLYVFMLLVPAVGWLMSSAKGFQTVYLGVVPVPDLLAKDEALGDLLAIVHASLAYLLAALVGIHAAAALKHHLIDRDDVLTRMLPGGDRA